jgi:hypothetical protein
MKNQRELQSEIVASLKSWQKLEAESIASTGEIMRRSANPIISLIMEIIQQDSKLHQKVQKWLADSLDKEALALSPDELVVIWDMVEKHINLEKQMVDNIKKVLSSLPQNALLIQKYFFEYLLTDEKKHDRLLADLKNFKRAMSIQP